MMQMPMTGRVAGFGQQMSPQQQLPWYLRALAAEGDDRQTASQKLLGFGSRLLASDPRQGFGQRFGNTMLGHQNAQFEAEQLAARNTMMRRDQERADADLKQRRESAERRAGQTDRQLDIREAELQEQRRRADMPRPGYSSPFELGEDYPGLYQSGPDGKINSVYRPPTMDPLMMMMLQMQGGVPGGVAQMGSTPNANTAQAIDHAAIMRQLNGARTVGGF